MAIETVPPAEKLLTAEEVFRLSTVNQRFELVKGVYVAMSPAGGQHGDIANTIAFILTQYVRQHDLGRVMAAKTGFLVARNPDTVRGADVAFISRERIPAEGVPVGYWLIAPDLAVEVVSPYDTPDEVEEKIEDYLAVGTRMVWVVYPKTRSLTVYRSWRDVKVLREQDRLSGEDVLPGFECPVSQVFS